jgi:hypothetical protein
VPLVVLNAVPVENAGWGQGNIWVEFKNAIELPGSDGRNYRAQMGFLSTPESLQAIQACWTQGSRGGPWKMKVVVRKQTAWVSCPSDKLTCWESKSDSGQSLLTGEVYYRDDVWRDLLNRYLSGGLAAVLESPYYDDIQATVFEPICGTVPSAPCVGIYFERL